jgi:SAM-dependent methyltransferase
MQQAFWNARYSEKEYAYGIVPNQFLKDYLDNLQPGRALFVAEGEGRNAVYAASQAWQVTAFDSSEVAKSKAMQLAVAQGQTISYQVADALEVQYPKDNFDLVVLVYAHFPSAVRQSIHQRLVSFLKPGGALLLEAFHVSQLGNASGGPKDIDMLHTQEIIQQDFKSLTTCFLEQTQIVLAEGAFHQGAAEVLRFIGKK